MSDQVDKTSLEVRVGEFAFRIRVPEAEVSRYKRIEAAANGVLDQIQQGAGALSGPRAMAMAMFQMAVEMEEAHEARRQAQESRDRLRQLINRIDRATDRPAGEPAPERGGPEML